jgi:hypothetical protein
MRRVAFGVLCFLLPECVRYALQAGPVLAQFLRQIMSGPQATQALQGSAALLPLMPVLIQGAVIVMGVGGLRHKLFLSMAHYLQQSITDVFPIEELP